MGDDDGDSCPRIGRAADDLPLALVGRDLADAEPSASGCFSAFEDLADGESASFAGVSTSSTSSPRSVSASMISSSVAGVSR